MNVCIPVPAFNLLSGGALADSPLVLEDILAVPVGARTFGEAMRMGTEIYSRLDELLSQGRSSSMRVTSASGGLVASDSVDTQTGRQHFKGWLQWLCETFSLGRP